MVVKCPICTRPMVVNSKQDAHERIKLDCYCESCDLIADIIMSQDKYRNMRYI